MINLRLLDKYRLTDERIVRHYGSIGDETCGAFEIASPIDKAPLLVIASQGDGWDHISVSRKNRIPNQTEMDHVYRLFFGADETAVQFFVPQEQHVNVHENCLHLWRPQSVAVPRPPKGFV